MNMRVTEKKRIFARDDLLNLLNNKYSCVLLKRCKRKIRLLPKYLREVKAGIQDALDKCLFKFDHSLNGFLLDYRNFSILPDKCNGTIVGRHGEFVVLVNAAFFVFQPEIGSQLEGIVNAKSDSHVGCLVHKCFNAMILKPENVESDEWNCKNIQIGDKIIFEVVDHALFGQVPYIQGKLPNEHVQTLVKRAHKKSTNCDISVSCINQRGEESSENESSDDSEKVITELNEENSLMKEESDIASEPANKKLPHRTNLQKVDSVVESRALSSTLIGPGINNEAMFVENFSPISQNDTPRAKKRKKETTAEVIDESFEVSGKEFAAPKAKKKKVGACEVERSPTTEASALEKSEVSPSKKKGATIDRSPPAKCNSSSDFVNQLLEVRLEDILSQCKDSPKKNPRQEPVKSPKSSGNRTVNNHENGELSCSPRENSAKKRQRQESFTETTIGKEKNPEDDSDCAVHKSEKSFKLSKTQHKSSGGVLGGAQSPKKSPNKSKKNLDAYFINKSLNKTDSQKNSVSANVEKSDVVPTLDGLKLTSPNRRKGNESKENKNRLKDSGDKSDEVCEDKSAAVDDDNTNTNSVGSPGKKKVKKGKSDLESPKNSQDHSSPKVKGSSSVGLRLVEQEGQYKNSADSPNPALEPVLNNVSSSETLMINKSDSDSTKKKVTLEKSKKSIKDAKLQSETSKKKNRKSKNEKALEKGESTMKDNLIEKLIKSMRVKNGLEEEEPTKKSAPASKTTSKEPKIEKEKKQKAKGKSTEAMNDIERSLMIDALLNEAKESLGFDDSLGDENNKSTEKAKKKAKPGAKSNSASKASKSAAKSEGRVGSADSGFNSLLEKQNE